MKTRACPAILSISLLFLLTFLALSCSKDSEDNLPEVPPEESLPELRWPAGEDMIITEDIYIDSVRFIVDPGVTVKIKSGCNIHIGSKHVVELSVAGSADHPINFIPYNPDGNPTEGYWGSVTVKKLKFDLIQPTFNYCNFIKGGANDSEALLVVKNRHLSMTNCLIDYSQSLGILADHNGGFVEFFGNTIQHTLDHPVSIPPGVAASIAPNNNILSDSLNKGIFLNMEGLNSYDEDIVWHGQSVSYILPNSLSVSNSSEYSFRFVLEEGVRIRLAKNGSIGIGKHVSFQANGTAENPVIFTSNETTPKPGDWKCISFNSSSASQLSHCIFEYGGLYQESMVDNGMVRLYNASQISIENSIFRHSQSPAVMLRISAINLPDPDFQSFKGNVFSNLESFSISLYPQNIQSIDHSNIFNGYDILVKDSDSECSDILWKNLNTEYYSESYLSIKGNGNGTDTRN